MQNFKTLRQSLLGELAMSPERKRERERERERKMPFIVATYVYASSQGQRTHSARTKPWVKRKFPFVYGLCRTALIFVCKLLARVDLLNIGFDILLLFLFHPLLICLIFASVACISGKFDKSWKC